MLRFSLLMLVAAAVYAADSGVDIDTAANLYQAGQVRPQVQASLGAMPAHVRQLFAADGANKLSEQQLAAVTAAAQRGFRIDVFEPPALSALAANLDPASVKKSQAFLESDLGRRMVAADVAAAQLDEASIDKVMDGSLVAPSTPERDALMDKLERASQYTESTVQIFLTMGQAVATGTATGSGMDPIAVTERARKSGEASRAGLQQNMREPLRRFMAYGYRDLSNADLKHLLSFFESSVGKRYTAAYIAAMSAGFDAMGRRCGEELGESLRELAQAQMPPEGMPPAGSAEASPGEAPPQAPPHP
jgi:Uncharacterized protein conserved in bacteria (DUF2059)